MEESADGRRRRSLNDLQVRRARNTYNFLIVKLGDGLPRVARLATCCNALNRGCEAWQKHVEVITKFGPPGLLIHYNMRTMIVRLFLRIKCRIWREKPTESVEEEEFCSRWINLIDQRAGLAPGCSWFSERKSII